MIRSLHSAQNWPYLPKCLSPAKKMLRDHRLSIPNSYLVAERKPPFRKGGQGGLDENRSIQINPPKSHFTQRGTLKEISGFSFRHYLFCVVLLRQSEKGSNSHFAIDDVAYPVRSVAVRRFSRASRPHYKWIVSRLEAK